MTPYYDVDGITEAYDAAWRVLEAKQRSGSALTWGDARDIVDQALAPKCVHGRTSSHDLLAGRRGWLWCEGPKS